MSNRKYPHQVARLVSEYVNDRLSEQVREIQHVGSTSGKAETIEEMHPTHAKNALARIYRELSAGKMAYLDDQGVIQFI